MKILSISLLLLLISLNCFAQNFQLELKGINISENKILDSLNYISKHQNLKSIDDEITTASEKLSKLGYLENQFLEKIKINDSCYSAKFRTGNKIKFIHIYIGEKSLFTKPLINQKNNVTETENTTDNKNTIIRDLIGFNTGKDTLIVSFLEIESFLNESIQKLEQQGYAFAKLKLIHTKIKNKILLSELQIELGTPKYLNEIVVKYANSDKKNSFPKGHLAQLNRKYQNRTFNKNSINEIYKDFEKLRFVSQIKYPEVLFTRDTTKVYVYLNERKSNTFDGFIGFANNESKKIRFNGYLDATLENTLKLGEQFSLYWKSDGNDQKTFTTGIEIPYLFKSPIGIKAKIHIFKQDSIFQNIKTEINLGYYADYNTRIFLGYQSTESSDIQNTNNINISDYNNSFVSSTLDYLKFDTQNSNFWIKSKLFINLGIGKRTTNEFAVSSGAIKQFYVNLQATHNFYLNTKNCININYHNYFLKSNTYLTNELYRFGGINSIRGFAENNFQASFANALQSEYRYIVSPNLYLYTLFDYCYYEDDSLNKKDNLTGLGLGFGLKTGNGLLKFAFANGKTKNENIELNKSIIHINYSLEF